HVCVTGIFYFFFSSRRRHTRSTRDWSSDVCSSDLIARAVTMMEEYLGRTFRAVMSVEIGGGNAIQPFIAAALLGKPVVDADAMEIGRASCRAGVQISERAARSARLARHMQQGRSRR